MSPHRSASVIAALVIVLVTASVAGIGALGSAADPPDRTALAARQANATGNATTPTITVTANGQASAEPDVAIVRVAAVAIAPTSSTAAERLARNVSRLREALLAANLSEEQIHTASYDIFPREADPEKDDGRNRTVFVARQVLEIRLDDTSRAGEIIDLAVANGADQVEGVAFTLSEQTRRELLQQALRDAVSNARGQATAIADSAGLELAGVRSISTVQPVFPLIQESTAAGAGDAPETVIDAGPLTVTATVTVTYNATA